MLLAGSHSLLHFHQLSLDTGNNSTCCMLNIADKIIQLASILINIVLGGNKQRQKEKPGWQFADADGPFQQRAQKVAGYAVEQILKGVLGSPCRGLDYRPLWAPGWTKKHSFGRSPITDGHLHASALNVSWTPKENWWPTESMFKRRQQSKQRVGHKEKRTSEAQEKKGKCREMERGIQAAISPSSSVPLVIHPASSQPFILILALQNEFKSSS